MIDPAEMDELFKTYGARALDWATAREMPAMIEKLHLPPEVADAFFKLLVLAWMEGAAAEYRAAQAAEASRPRILLRH